MEDKSSPFGIPDVEWTVSLSDQLRSLVSPTSSAVCESNHVPAKLRTVECDGVWWSSVLLAKYIRASFFLDSITFSCYI